MTRLKYEIMLVTVLGVLFATIVVVMVVACRGRGRSAATATTVSGTTTVHAGPYLPPQPPATLADSGKHVWMAEHYWDSFDFADTAQLADMECMGPAFGIYLQILHTVPQPQAAASIRGMLDRAMAGNLATFERFTDWFEETLYDPNSPLRCEELYIPVLEYIVASPQVDSLMKIRPQSQLDMALKNRPGDVATDFTYTTPDGRSHRLSALKAHFTLLYFYNPDCPACREIKEYIRSSVVFGDWMDKTDGLRVLAVYPDEDLDLWRERLPQIPEAWIVGCDPGHKLMDDRLYDLKAIPTIYLLDSSKRVILKDVPVEVAEEWLAAEAAR